MIWTIIQLVISGIAMGFVYALIGIEYTLIYNASGVLNFSHDKMVSLGAYIYAGMFVLGLGWNSVVSAIASLLLMAGVRYSGGLSDLHSPCASRSP